MKVKSEREVAQSCPTLATPWTAAYQAPPWTRQIPWTEEPGRLQSMGSLILAASQQREISLISPS